MKLRGKLSALALFVTLMAGTVTAQISEGGQPPSFSRSVQSDLQTVRMPTVNVLELMAEDELEQRKEVPFRFGAPFDVDYTLDNSGTWEIFDDGSRLWRLKIESRGAYSLNLIYRRFDLPDGAQFFLYNEDHSMLIGAFTSRNNKTHGKFATGLVKGDACILEYYEPANVSYPGVIDIERVVHAYRNFFDFDEAKDFSGFGDAGSCNNNVACPVGDDWRDDIRASVILLTSGGFRFCSGSMVNNVRQDLTPYLLTANHCLGGEETWIFMFNYESPVCSNVDGPTWMTVSGSSRKASASFSDFGLLLLDEQPPDSYNVYYSGWSAVDIAADSCVAIHHPSGDIKKISFNYDDLTSTSYLGTTPGNNSHWRIDNWEDGTTEPGSSGSPIFDFDHRILGQLHGGYASCASITSDWYGKFSVSWDNGGTASSRLRDWLDPDNTGTLLLDGLDASGTKITHTPLEDTRDSLNDYQILATITSPAALTPESLLVYYQIASVWYEDTLEATFNADEFEGFIPAQSPGTQIDYYLFARDDDGNSDTTDTFSFRVLDYGLTMTPEFDQRTVAALDTAWYTLEVTNVGIFADDYSLVASGNLWPTSILDETGTVVISSTGSLLMDESLIFKILVEVPTSMYGDYDSVQITATSTGDPTVFATSELRTTSAGEPFSLPFSDNFASGTLDVGKWVENVGAEVNSIGLNPPSAPYSLNLNGFPSGADSVTSQAINLKNEPSVIVSYYYQRTGGGNSTEDGDNLYLSYLDSLGNWNLLSQQDGIGPDMTTFEQVELVLPGNAYHSNFRLRIHNIGTSGAFDDWFVDNIFVGHPTDYDVLITPTLTGGSGPSGDTASYLLTIHNRGLLDDTYDLSDSGGLWPMTFFDETGTTIITSTGLINSADSIRVVAKVAIPSGAAIHDVDTTAAVATSQGDPGVSGVAVIGTEAGGLAASYPWFESFPDPVLNAGRWFYNAGATISTEGIGAPSDPYSLNLDGGNDTVITQMIDLSAKASVILSYYFQQGGGGEEPDNGDDLKVEYLNSVGVWTMLNQHLGSDPAMTSFDWVSMGIPPDGLHSGFQLRLISNGTCVDCDDWYVDDIRVDYAPSISSSPLSFEVSLVQDDSTTEQLIITNGGPGGLNYSIRVLPLLKENSIFVDLLAEDKVEPARRIYPEGFHDYVESKGADDPRIGFPTDKGAGGPDLFGYFWIDSDEVGGPLFEWEDVSTIGTDIVSDLSDDNFGGPYSIGMDFPFYGGVYNVVYIGSNGLIGFGAAGMESRFKVNIPNPATPNNMLAWLWDDLNPNDPSNPGAHVYIHGDGSRCVIQFAEYPEYSAATGDVVNAEIILYADGTIRYQYLTIAAGFDIASCAIGIENADGTDGLEVAYLTSYLHDGLSIQFYRPEQWLELDQLFGDLSAGQADTVDCKFTSLSLEGGVYNANIIVSSNDPDPANNPLTITAQLTVSDQPPYICGDVDGDGTGPIIIDVVYMVDYLFRGGPAPPIEAAADVDGSFDLSILDIIYIVAYLFDGGPAPICQ